MPNLYLESDLMLSVALSVTAYMVATVLAFRTHGMTLSSTTLRFLVPQIISFSPSTPPIPICSIVQVPTLFMLDAVGQ